MGLAIVHSLWWYALIHKLAVLQQYTALLDILIYLLGSFLNVSMQVKAQGASIDMTYAYGNFLNTRTGFTFT